MYTYRTIKCPACRIVLKAWYQSGVKTIVCSCCLCEFSIEQHIGEDVSNCQVSQGIASYQSRTNAWCHWLRGILLRVDLKRNDLPICLDSDQNTIQSDCRGLRDGVCIYGSRPHAHWQLTSGKKGCKPELTAHESYRRCWKRACLFPS